jgi:hypothetical protein
LALEFVAPANSQSVAPTKILVQNSLIGAGPSEQATILASFSKWPQQSKAGATGVALEIRSSLILGWSHLAVGTPEGIGFVQNVDGWKTSFQADAQPEQFQFGAWPEEPIRDLDAIEPQALDASAVVVTGVEASDGGQVGCRINGLHAPPRVFVTRAAGMGDGDMVAPEGAAFGRPPAAATGTLPSAAATSPPDSPGPRAKF